MYNSEYVRKKKRRKAVAIITGISGVTVSVFVIISFLGKYVGTFTVKLENGSIRLALQEYTGSSPLPDIPAVHDESEPSTYLRVGSLPNMREYTFSNIIDVMERVDNENTSWKDAAIEDDFGDIAYIDYFKMTFYVRNLGSSTTNYTVSINITDSKASEDGRKLDDTLRVMLFENRLDNKHDYTVYAKRSQSHHEDENGDLSYQEAISYSPEYAAQRNLPFYGYAQEFESDNCIAKYDVENFFGGEVMRYTIVYWLEGFDPESKNTADAPRGANIKLGVEINAYEKDENE